MTPRVIRLPLTCCRFQARVDRGEIAITADKWPAFLYDEEEYDATDEWEGLFLGETFVRVRLPWIPPHPYHSQHYQGCICVLVGPSAAQDWPYRMPSSRSYAASQKKGNAVLNDIKEITPEVVAGLVCQVRPSYSWISVLTQYQITFALSDAGSWKDKIGDIDLVELYTNTVRMLRMDCEWVDMTLDTLQR